MGTRTGQKPLAFVLEAPHDEHDAWLWAGEPIVIDGQAVDQLSSGGDSNAARRCIGMGDARGRAAMRARNS